MVINQVITFTNIKINRATKFGRYILIEIMISMYLICVIFKRKGTHPFVLYSNLYHGFTYVWSLKIAYNFPTMLLAKWVYLTLGHMEISILDFGVHISI